MVGRGAKHRCFKPAGIPMRKNDVIEMALDELEALRLVDVEDLKHEPAAAKLQVSRPTLTRILASARKKTATAITEGKALIIEGGEVEIQGVRNFTCKECNNKFEEPFGAGKPQGCPKCGGQVCRVK